MRVDKIQNRLNHLKEIVDLLKVKSGTSRLRHIRFRIVLNLLDPKKLKTYPPNSEIVDEALAYIRSQEDNDSYLKALRASNRVKNPKSGQSIRGFSGKAKFNGGKIFSGSGYKPIDKLAMRVSGFRGREK